jgi:hypothetical protein
VVGIVIGQEMRGLRVTPDFGEDNESCDHFWILKPFRLQLNVGFVFVPYMLRGARRGSSRNEWFVMFESE